MRDRGGKSALITVGYTPLRVFWFGNAVFRTERSPPSQRLQLFSHEKCSGIAGSLPARERLPYTCIMIRQIAPLFFTTDIPSTLAYYKDKLGFERRGTWQDPPVYAIVARDRQVIHFRCAKPPTPNPDKYREELLDAY